MSTSSPELSGSLRTVRGGATALVGLLLVLRSAVLDLDLHTLCVVVSVLALSGVWATTKVSTRGMWSAASAYLVVFVLFHFGLAFLEAAGQPPPEYALEYVSSWFNSYGSAREALYLSVLACWVFVCAYSWALSTGRRTGQPGSGSSTHVSGPGGAGGTLANVEVHLAVASRLGAALVLLGTIVILGYVAVNLPTLLLGQGGRSAYWNSVEGSVAQLLSTPLITCGGILLAIGRPTTARTVGLTCLVLFGSWAMVVGARTSIMYTVLTMLVVLARRRPMPSGRVAVMLFATSLVVVGFVGQARLSGGYSERASLDPRAGLTEMGGSIRPVIEVVQFRRANREPLLYGVTYVSFVSRAVEGALGLPRPDGLTDPRIAGNEFRGQFDGYQIGYSAVAEAVRNGDLPGVLIVFSIFGGLFGRLDGRRARSPAGDYTVGIIFFALAFHVRQPSVSLVANILVGLLPLLCLRLLAPTSPEADIQPLSAPARTRARRHGPDGAPQQVGSPRQS